MGYGYRFMANDAACGAYSGGYIAVGGRAMITIDDMQDAPADWRGIVSARLADCGAGVEEVLAFRARADKAFGYEDGRLAQGASTLTQKGYAAAQGIAGALRSDPTADLDGYGGELAAYWILIGEYRAAEAVWDDGRMALADAAIRTLDARWGLPMEETAGGEGG